jgi:pimeloyl-ACP methyl ester carboxylesterase
MSNPMKDLRSFPYDATPAPHKAVVFIHGIYSDHKTFGPLYDGLSNDARFVDWDFYYFDYKFHESIRVNGNDLADSLKLVCNDSCVELTLVAHSMGGLVARLALLQFGDELPCVKRLVMLGTPNHGTMHTGRLGLLAHITREATGKLWAVFSRKTGVKELSEVGEVVKEHLRNGGITKTRGVEYISIPALYYHEEASIFRHRRRNTSLGLRALDLGFELLQAIPHWRVGLRRPHDGIVEASSVYLGNEGGARFSERNATCNGEPNCGAYLHIEHLNYREEDHVSMHIAEQTITILRELFLATSTDAWRSSVVDTEPYDFRPPRR